MAADKFDITKADVKHLLAQWDGAGHSLKHGIQIRHVRPFVSHLSGKFGHLDEIDRCVRSNSYIFSASRI